jgi:hypothetical protein
MLLEYSQAMRYHNSQSIARSWLESDFHFLEETFRILDELFGVKMSGSRIGSRIIHDVCGHARYRTLIVGFRHKQEQELNTKVIMQPQAVLASGHKKTDKND